jgi:hypothetical protein
MQVFVPSETMQTLSQQKFMKHKLIPNSNYQTSQSSWNGTESISPDPGSDICRFPVIAALAMPPGQAPTLTESDLHRQKSAGGTHMALTQGPLKYLDSPSYFSVPIL